MEITSGECGNMEKTSGECGNMEKTSDEYANVGMWEYGNMEKTSDEYGNVGMWKNLQFPKCDAGIAYMKKAFSLLSEKYRISKDDKEKS